MPRPVCDRLCELHALELAWTSGRPELLVGAGLRRAGESYLLPHAMTGFDAA